jgi:hypothetical protein
VIVLDEHLQGVQLEVSIRRWYRGRVCFVTELRPGSIIKDEAVPSLLRTASRPTFVTLNWQHFWQRTPAHSGFCLTCFTIPNEGSRVAEVSPLLRRLFRLKPFSTKTKRMGKIARIADERVTYYQVQDPQIYVHPLP